MQSNKARYHAEYHSKINSITLSVQVPPSGVTCRIGPQAIDLIPSIQPGLTSDDEIHQEEEKGVAVTCDRLLLPARVMPTRTTLDPSSSRSNLLSLKLTALPNMPLEISNSSSSSAASTTEFPPPPLPASQLQGLENLACGSCGNILLNSTSSLGLGSPSGPIQRVVDLPSEHWQELVDCWMCHEEDFTELREGDLGARHGQALVGGTYLLIHAKDVEHHAVMIEEDARSIDVSHPSSLSLPLPTPSSHHGLLEDRRLELPTDRCRYSSPTLILKVENATHLVCYLQHCKECQVFCVFPFAISQNRLNLLLFSNELCV